MHSHARYNRGLARQYERWMIAMHYAKMTQCSYRKIIWRYVKFFGKRSVANASHNDIRRFIGSISEDGATLSTAYQNLGVLRLFYDFLNLGGVVSYVAPRFVRLRRPQYNSFRPLKESQIRRVILATRTLRERALVELFYGTGCRLSEAIRLTIEDLDLEGRTARIKGKFGKVRTALLTRGAVDALRAYIADRRSGFIFQQDMPVQKGCLHAQDGKWMSKWGEFTGFNSKRIQRCKYIGLVRLMPYEIAKARHVEHISSLNLVRLPRKSHLSKVAVQKVIQRIARRAGLKHVTPHTFRRTFATHLYDHGATVEVIKALMGHVWIQTTLKYAQIGPDRIANTFERCHPREKLKVQSLNSPLSLVVS
jgi:integrase/recombinase XerD